MARVYPSNLRHHAATPVEQELYGLLSAQLPDDYTVIHRVPWIIPDRARHHRCGFVHFLILHPLHGVVALNVVAGTVHRHGNRWFTVDDAGVERVLEFDPMRMVVDSERALNRVISLAPSTARHSAGIRIRASLAFPNIDVGAEGFGSDTPRHMLFDSRDLTALEPAIQRMASAGPQGPALSDRAIEALVRLFAPPAVVDSPDYADRSPASPHLEHSVVTAEQHRAIEALESQRQLAISGVAGSGKSFLALSHARFLALNGLRVLITCRNQDLADQFRRGIQTMPDAPVEQIHVEHLAALATRVLNRSQSGVPPAPGFPASDYVDRILPNALRHALDDEVLRFDAVIVDDGHEFSPEMWEATQALLADRDYARLVTFVSSEFPWHGDSTTLPVPTADARLTVNLRSPAAIHEIAIRYLPAGPTPMSAGPGGPPPGFVPAMPANFNDSLSAEVTRLIGVEGVSPGDIVVLTPATREESQITDGFHAGPARLTWESPAGADHVLVRQIDRFRGLERPVVVLVTEFGETPSPRRDWLTYTALTRASRQLVVIGELPPPEVTLVTNDPAPTGVTEPNAVPGTATPAPEDEAAGRIEPTSETGQAFPSPFRSRTGKRLRPASLMRISPKTQTGPTIRRRIVRPGSARPAVVPVELVDAPAIGLPSDGAVGEEPGTSTDWVDSTAEVAESEPALAPPGPISQRIAGALAYLLWPVVPILLLVTPLRRDRANRLHAAQSTVFVVFSAIFLVTLSILSALLAAYFPPLVNLFWVGLALPPLLAILIFASVLRSGHWHVPVLTAVTRDLFKRL